MTPTITTIMYITRITLENFRNVGTRKSYWFKSRFTVIIGINGRGKSTILQALRVACGTFFQGIPGISPRGIKSDEIRQVKAEGGLFLVEKRPVLVEAEGFFRAPDELVTWRRRILEKSNSNTSSRADVGAIAEIGERLYTEINQRENDKVSLPIIAFFGTSRVHGAGRNISSEKESRLGRQIFKDGYRSWDEMKSFTFQYVKWLAGYESALSINQEYAGTKEAFFGAIVKGNRYIRKIEDRAGVLWFDVKYEGEDGVSDFLPIDLHSDGIRFFTGMVAELAYRCIILNAFLGREAIAESRGVVLIDELDLHLHPIWQKDVVSDLKTAFPNLQFVITTHSPFIIQSINSEELINLDTEIPTAIDPDNLPLNKVATEIQGVESVRSEEFELKLKSAKEMMAEFEAEGKTLTTDDYVQISEVLGSALKDETNDPFMQAFLEVKQKEENEADK